VFFFAMIFAISMDYTGPATRTPVPVLFAVRPPGVRTYVRCDGRT
jgi:hypothetical protein